MSEVEFPLPDVGEGLASAEITQWLVAVGDVVHENQPVVVVETDKAQVEIPSPATGTIAELGAEVGTTLSVGATLIRVTTNGTPPLDAPADPTTARTQERRRQADGPPPAPEESPKSPGRRVLAAPATRRRATELDVDLTTVTGTGPQGRITLSDVQAAAEQTHAPSIETTAAQQGTSPSTLTGVSVATDTALSTSEPSAAAQPQVVPLRGLRRQVAQSMTQAWQVPHITEFREVDATELVRARHALNARTDPQGIKLTYLPLLLSATIAALRAHPRFNARLDMEHEEIHYHGSVHLGLATATPDGLLVPVVHDADRLPLTELARRSEELSTSARARTLAPEQLTGGTFTVSNFGSNGTWLGTPIIRSPEVGLVGFGQIRDTVVAVNGAAVVRPVLPVAAATDHRLNDGSHLAAFLDTLTELATDPVLLLGKE